MTVDDALARVEYEASIGRAQDSYVTVEYAALDVLGAEVRRLRAIQAGKVVDALYERANRVDFQPAFDERSAVVAYLRLDGFSSLADDILKGEHLK